ncbi:hypothetical protein BJ170DRAFT_694094 [Xylariales sp. AK1849]|nr:hypothetical protein BJ170DRAFT_694094 [Xylariales sp. AK1849]
MRPSTYPPILPAAPFTVPPLPSGHLTRDLSSKRPMVPIACNGCRRRKTRCDGGRPICSNCSKRGLSECVYAENRKAVGSSLLDVLNLFKTLPEVRAIDLLRTFREKEIDDRILSTFKPGITDTPSGVVFTAEAEAELEVEQEVPPSSESPQSSLESELMAKNPNAYPALLPIIASELAQSSLLRPGRLTVPPPQRPLTTSQRTARSRTTGNTPNPVESDSVIQDIRPALDSTPPSEHCDERLCDLDIGFWTDVEVTNEFAAHVISLYIKTDHPLLGFFDPRLFLDDLINQREKFCSRFLVHALMHLGCQMHQAFDENANTVADSFFHEAERLWGLGNGEPTYLNMAGAAMLSLSLMGRGKDHSVLLYTIEATKIGTALGLFGADVTAASTFSRTMSTEDRSASCYAAWGGFNWNVLVSLFYRQPGSQPPVSPPTLPVPVERYNTMQESDGIDGSARQSLMGDTFPALCHFWRIVQRSEWDYYPDKNSPPKAFRSEFMEYNFRELIAWAETLPPVMLHDQHRSHHVAVFHIWLHAAILDLFRPHIRTNPDQRRRMRTFASPESFPDNAYTASVNQLKSLVVEYRSNHQASTYSVLWHTGLLYLANATLHNTEDPEWRLYFMLCIYGYESLRRPYPMSDVVIQGLLSMTLRYTDMPGSEARQILDSINKNGLRHVSGDMMEQIRATFVVDLDLALTDPESAKAENMAGDFEHLAAFRDYLETDLMDD